MGKKEWTPRRGERFQEKAPPSEHEMFRNVQQLRTEAQLDIQDSNFHDSINSARSKSFAQAAKSAFPPSAQEKSVLTELTAARGLEGTPRPGHQRTFHSQTRIEPTSR